MKISNRYENLVRFVLSFIIWALVSAVWGFVWFCFYAETILQPFYFRGDVLVIFIYSLLLYFFSRFYGKYQIGLRKKGDAIFSGILALIFCNAYAYTQTSLLYGWIAPAMPIIAMTLVQSLFIFAWGIIGGKFFAKAFLPRELLMVYGGEHLAGSLQQKMMQYKEKYAVRTAIDIAEGLEKITEMSKDYDGVILCDLPSELRNDLLKFCFLCGKQTYTTPKIPDILLRGASEMELFDTPLLHCTNGGFTTLQRFVKRLMDIFFALFGAVAALPFVVLIIPAVKLYDMGPVLYRQQRLTKNGRVFWLYKFRSMIVDAERLCGARLAEDDDDRVTPVGKVLRNLRFDELPQLWNILKGDMSVVGPRPERPEIASKYQKEMPEFEYRLRVKAGLTGLAQTVGRYNTTAYDKLKMDLAYITNYSVRQDIKLIFMTVKIVLFGS